MKDSNGCYCGGSATLLSGERACTPHCADGQLKALRAEIVRLMAKVKDEEEEGEVSRGNVRTLHAYAVCLYRAAVEVRSVVSPLPEGKRLAAALDAAPESVKRAADKKDNEK